MISAADFLLVLNRRAQLDAHRRRPPGEFPAGWQCWLDELQGKRGRVVGAPAGAFVDEMMQREVAPAGPRAPVLSQWQAFTTLWRQQWHPAEPEERGTRWFAGAVSGGWHVLFGALLLWLMHVQYLAAVAPPLGEDVVQVEYIGRGTPDEAGGPTEPQVDAAAAQPRSAEAPQTVSGAPPAAEVPPSSPDVPARELPQPVATPPAEQPVAVSEPTPVPDPEAFVLPPTQPRVAQIEITAPELRVRPTQVETIDVPEPVRQVPRELPQAVLSPRPVDIRVPDLVARDVPAPLPRITTPSVPAPRVDAPVLRAPTAVVRERAVPAPSPRVAPQPVAATQSPSPTPTDAQARAERPAAPTTRSVAPATTGAGPTTATSPGAPRTSARADDWGDSTRSVPGGQRGSPSGLLDSNGRPRVGQAPGSASPGQPPGTITQEIANLDRAGTWLKRKPVDYTPTAFDDYWRPNETLLQEWVRRSVQEVYIPIPGTGKRVVCKVSVLALGGACGISDPNLNEQPATARPPPDIPFKPHLQEGNGSVREGG